MKTVSKKVKPLGFETNHEKHAIVVNYETQITLQDQNGNQKVEKQSGSKVFPLESFSQADIPEITDELIRSCSLIDPQKRASLLKCVASLITGETSNPIQGEASMDMLNEYTDALYEEIPAKISSTEKIMQLCNTKENLPTISGNDTIIAALARTLRDDGLKSLELGTNICYTFYVISHYQALAQPLISHKVPESLAKMTLTEDQRYTTIHQKLASQKKSAQNGNAQQKQQYKQEYDNFKLMITSQDKMLFLALSTIINLSEYIESRTGSVNYFIPYHQLVPMLVSILKRKPINPSLITIVLNFLKRLTLIETCFEFLKDENVCGYLVKLLDDEDQPYFEPIMGLLYNMAFNPEQKLQQLDFGIAGKLAAALQKVNARIMNKYKDEIDPKGTLIDQLVKICQNHKTRGPPDEEMMALLKKAEVVGKFVCQLGQNPDDLKRFEDTDIGQQLVVYNCLSKEPDKILVNALQIAASNAHIAMGIANANMLQPLNVQFQNTKNADYAKVFTSITAAIPHDQKVTKGGAQISQNAEMVFKNALEIAKVAADSGNEDLQNEALAMIAQAPASFIEKDQAQQVTKMAMNCIGKEKDVKKRMNGVGVICTMLSRAAHVQLMMDNGDLNTLPQQLLQLLVQGLGKTNIKIDIIGIDYKTCEFDMVILILICFVKCVSYKYLRKLCLQNTSFLTTMIRLLYNQKRDPDDENGIRPATLELQKKHQQDMLENPSSSMGRSKMGLISRGLNSSMGDGKRGEKSVIQKETEKKDEKKKKQVMPLIVESALSTPEERSTHAEPEQFDEIKRIKYMRYNADFMRLIK